LDLEKDLVRGILMIESLWLIKIVIYEKASTKRDNFENFKISIKLKLTNDDY